MNDINRQDFLLRKNQVQESFIEQCLGSRVKCNKMGSVNMTCSERNMIYDQVILSKPNNELKYNNYTRKNASCILTGNKARDAVNFAKSVQVYTEETGMFSIENDTVNISIDDVTEIDKTNLPKVKAENNTLILKAATYYEIENTDGSKGVLAVSEGLESPPCTDEVLHRSEYSCEYRIACGDTAGIMQSLIQSPSPIGAYFVYGKEQVAETLKTLGIKPGKFTIGIDGYKTQTFYLNNKGIVYSYADNASRLISINKTNYKEQYNFTDGSKVVIDGVDYSLDENGYFHVPDDTMYVGDVKFEDKDGRQFNIKYDNTLVYKD